jgi:hypothetical protein
MPASLPRVQKPGQREHAILWRCRADGTMRSRKPSELVAADLRQKPVPHVCDDRTYSLNERQTPAPLKQRPPDANKH